MIYCGQAGYPKNDERRDYWSWLILWAQLVLPSGYLSKHTSRVFGTYLSKGWQIHLAVRKMRLGFQFGVQPSWLFTLHTS